MKKIKGYNIVKEKTNELLVSIEIGNNEVIEKDGYKVIPFYEEENPTIEQNAGENQIEGGVISISGSVNIPDIKLECKTCRNPYCSRTLEERQSREVQVHWQYGWECEDKEKWLSHSGGFEFIKKEKK